MKFDSSMKLLVERREIHEFMRGLWTPDGPIAKSHDEGGYVWDIVDQFADLPRIFAQASDLHNEWTHYSPYWGVTLFADYENTHIRDLRYIHEIYHGATQPYQPEGLRNLATLEMKNFDNEADASTVSELEIYLALPELRALSFPHPILIDRILFPGGNFSKPDEGLIQRWKERPGEVFRDLKYTRASVVLAKDNEVDMDDPVIEWLRRYPEQKHNWLDIWSERYGEVEDAMLRLRNNVRTIGRQAALDAHLAWLKSVSDKGIPFYKEAVTFRKSYDRLIEAYNQKMRAQGYEPVSYSNEKKTHTQSATREESAVLGEEPNGLDL